MVRLYGHRLSKPNVLSGKFIQKTEAQKKQKECLVY
jgi:hypothetical protein